MRWAERVASMREIRGAHSVLVGKPEEKRNIENTRRRWKNNIKIDLKTIERGHELD
jgi:hypothetical protein